MNIISFQKKIKTNYIRLIYHLKGVQWKNVIYTTSGVTIYVFKDLCLWFGNSLLRWYNQFGNITLSFALFWSLKRILIIKYFVG